MYVPPVSLLVVIYVAKSFVKKKNTHTRATLVKIGVIMYKSFCFGLAELNYKKLYKKRVLSSNTNSNIDGLGYLHVELFLICRVRASHPLHTASNFA